MDALHNFTPGCRYYAPTKMCPERCNPQGSDGIHIIDEGPYPSMAPIVTYSGSPQSYQDTKYGWPIYRI